MTIPLRQELRQAIGMASIRKRSGKWRAEVCRDGQRESATFLTKAQAVAWAQLREAELGGERLPDNSVRDAFLRYADEVSIKRRGCRWEQLRLWKLAADPLAASMAAYSSAAVIAAASSRAWRLGSFAPFRDA